MPWHSQARHDVFRIAVQLGDDRINQTVALWIIVRPSNDGSERRFDNGSVRLSARKALTFSGVCTFELMDMVLRCCATEDVPP
jgi:hypothetical protein